MLTIEEIKKELDAGREVELECVNEYGFINNNKGRVREKEEILSSSLVVQSVDDGRNVVLHSSYFLRESDLEYFRIKRPAPTFKDLVSVAVKAYEDGFLPHLELYTGGLSSIAVECADDSSGKVIERAIGKIKALYKETFVIEHASDMERIKRTAIIVLENDYEVCAESDCLHHGVNYIQTTYGGMNFNLSFVSLKGATVTQKRA